MDPAQIKRPLSRFGAGRRHGKAGRIEHWLRYAGATLFGLVVFFFVIGVPALMIVTSTYGLGDTVRKKAEEALGGEFYKITVERVLFNPMRGFILDRLEIHDRTPAQRLVVSANRLSISLNLESLVRNQARLERISLNDANLDIPLGPKEEPRLRLDHVRGLILCPPEQLRLTIGSFQVAGITVRASGTFLNPKRFSPKPVSDKGPGNIAMTIDSIQKQLREIQWTGAPPLLTIAASGDLSNSETLRVESATFRSGVGDWRGVHLQESSFELHYETRKLTLEKVILNDGRGVFQADGWADFGANKASLEFTGGLNAAVIPILFLDAEKARDWNWIDPIRLSGSMTAGWGSGSPVVDGNALFEAGRLSYRGVSVNSLSGGIALQSGKMLIRDFHLEGDPGKIDADLMIAPGDNRLRLAASLYPEKLAPAVEGKTKEALSSMDFKEPLTLQFEGAAPNKDPNSFQGSGTLALGKSSMRGAVIDSLNAKLLLENGAMNFRDIVVKIGEGVGKGIFIYDFKNWEGRLPEVRSTLDPVKVMTWIDPHIAEAVKIYRFHKPPELRVSGKVGLRNPDKNDLRIAVNAPSGLDYTLIQKNLSFGATSGTLLLKGQKIAVDIPNSKLFGGAVSLKANVSVIPGDTKFGASVHLDDVDFQALAKLYFDYNDSSGRLFADYTFDAVGGNDRAMTGTGNLRIKDGNILAMPILGPLSLLLNEVIPGFGYQSARNASADFTVQNGVINTKNLLIKGTGFSMIGYGDIYYLDDRMNMNIRLNAQGLPGLALFVVSKALEYESVGSAKHPKWRPKILQKL